VRIWDAAGGQLVLALKGHRGFVRSLAFTVDTKRLVSAGNDGTLRLWDTSSGKELLSLKSEHSYEDKVAFSPDGTLLAAISGGVVQVWDSRPLTAELRAQRTVNQRPKASR
jgi:WD40 repeat protein